jgi:hypothetical protein
MPLELPGPGETIEVCQHCGHVIDPGRVTFQGSVYEIRLCIRDECVAQRIADAVWGDFREEAEERMRQEYRLLLRRMSYMPIIYDPRSIILGCITGI